MEGTLGFRMKEGCDTFQEVVKIVMKMTFRRTKKQKKVREVILMLGPTNIHLSGSGARMLQTHVYSELTYCMIRISHRRHTGKSHDVSIYVRSLGSDFRFRSGDHTREGRCRCVEHPGIFAVERAPTTHNCYCCGTDVETRVTNIDPPMIRPPPGPDLTVSDSGPRIPAHVGATWEHPCILRRPRNRLKTHNLNPP